MQKLCQFWCSEKAAAVLPRTGADVIFYYRSWERYYCGYFRGYFRSGPKTRHKSSCGRHGCIFLVPLASSSTATICGSTVRSSGNTVRTSGSTAPVVLLAFCLLAVVFQRGTTALAVVPLLGAVVPLCAGCEHNGWIFSHL